MSLGENIKLAREARGWSQGELAAQAKTVQQNISRLEKGEVQTSSHLPAIARALELPLEALVGTTVPNPPPRTPTLSIISGDKLVSTDRIPVYGAVEGGQGALTLSNEPVDTVKTPAPLATVRGGYGVIITGESMVPAFWPGDIALVNPHIPPRIESDVVLYGENGDGDVRAMIKNLVRQTPDFWKLKQYNPGKEFEVSKAEWRRCDVVVGKYSRR